MSKLQEYLVWGFLCFIMVMAIVVQINTVKAKNAIVARTTTEAKLRDNVLKVQEKYDKKYEELNEITKELNKEIENATKNNEGNGVSSEELKKYKQILGENKLTGAGLVITVDDAEDLTKVHVLSDALIHDGDLQEIVNYLFSGGADAVSINEERIVNGSSINCFGNVISINGKKIGAPYEIKAIGSVERLYGELMVKRSCLVNLASYGIKVNIEKKENIEIPKYTGIYNLKYIEESVEEE